MDDTELQEAIATTLKGELPLLLVANGAELEKTAITAMGDSLSKRVVATLKTRGLKVIEDG